MSKVFAHRGLHTTERENTLPAMVAALDIGVDGVELDVHCTRDGVVVVHHDRHVRGTAIDRQQWRDLPDDIPMLEDVLLAMHEVTLNVEIKSPWSPWKSRYVTRATVAVLQKHPHLDIIVSSFRWRVCREVQHLWPEGVVGWLVYRGNALRHLRRVRRRGLANLHLSIEQYSSTLRGLAREAGVALAVWTVNDVAHVDLLLRDSVEIIISDDPVLVMERRRVMRAGE